MELLRLRKRVALAGRGHRLLSEKRDEISRQLIQIARDIAPLRQRVEAELLETCRRFMLARAVVEPEHTKAALDVPTKKFSLAVELANVMNVKVPNLSKEISGEIICYGCRAAGPGAGLRYADRIGREGKAGPPARRRAANDTQEGQRPRARSYPRAARDHPIHIRQISRGRTR